MNAPVVFYILGKLVLAETAILAIPLAYSFLTGDGATLTFLFSAFLSATTGYYLQQKGAPADALTMRDGIAITTFGWLIAAAIGMLPYTLGAYLTPVDGLFESMSGFTGTGATVIPGIETLPPSILLWRMMTHWFGGLGIIVIFIALLPQTGHSAIYMYNAETTTATRDRVMPRLRDMTKALFLLYVGLTAICAACYYLCGLSIWEAITHAMSTIGAGGFSTYDDSVMHFHSLPLEITMTLFMAIAGANFGLYYRALQKGPKTILKNTEFRWYIAILVIATTIITIDLAAATGLPLAGALRYASFQTASLSTTGFVSTDFDTWPGLAKGVILLLMITGGCAGSTAGGLKIARVVILAKNALAVIHQKLSPRSIIEIRLNGAPIPIEKITATEVFFFLYITLILLFALCYTAAGIPTFDALAISITTLGCVGPAFGIAGATGTYAPLPDLIKTLLCLEMLLGRLELFTLLVLLRPGFWKLGNRW